MFLRQDHVAGGAFVIGGVLVFAASGDLPFGTLASPGAGMMPKLLLGMMIIFGLVLMARGGSSPPFAQIDWSDLGHALCVIIAAALATALYTALGFVLTMSLLLLGLTAAVERKPPLRALAFSIGTALLTYFMFSSLLKSPMPPDPFGYF
jgi:tripartite tricarboxylate transporter TctB family protein